MVTAMSQGPVFGAFLRSSSLGTLTTPRRPAAAAATPSLEEAFREVAKRVPAQGHTTRRWPRPPEPGVTLGSVPHTALCPDASGVWAGSLLMLITLVPRTTRLTFLATLYLDGRGHGSVVCGPGLAVTGASRLASSPCSGDSGRPCRLV